LHHLPYLFVTREYKLNVWHARAGFTGLFFAQDKSQEKILNVLKSNTKQKGRKHALLHQSSRFSDPGGADKILLAVDDSLASRKAANYVADLARRKKELSIHIFHASDPLPTELQEFRGAENPDDEKTLDAELRRKRNSWEQKAKRAAEPLIKKNALDAGASRRCARTHQFPEYRIDAP
jgi:hypothetical protein